MRISPRTRRPSLSSQAWSMTWQLPNTAASSSGLRHNPGLDFTAEAFDSGLLYVTPDKEQFILEHHEVGVLIGL
ncbi:hypothetical protein BDW62DRAFT_172196 [Aspergillus aurantiobrunneus]